MIVLAGAIPVWHTALKGPCLSQVSPMCTRAHFVGCEELRSDLRRRFGGCSAPHGRNFNECARVHILRFAVIAARTLTPEEGTSDAEVDCCD